MQHLAATPAGHEIIADAEVTKIDGRRIEFDVTARDEVEYIGKGTHQRVVVDLSRLAARLDSKKQL